jgi:hypothetical protein
VWQRLSDRAPVWAPVAFVASLAAVVASSGVIGGDLPWLVPLGAVVASGHIPDAVPTAAASTASWHDALAGGQLVIWFVDDHLGLRGLLLLQVIAAVAGFGSLAFGLRRESAGGGVLLVSALVLIGTAPTVLVTRVGLFSLALFPVLVLLVYEDARAPGRRIWLTIPLLALWANLHGMVLAGVAVLGAYLLLDRARRDPLLSVGVGAASIAAIFLTPELWRTPLYYKGVFDNLAAARGLGLWAPLGVRPFDVAYVVSGLALLLCARFRLRLWEWMACLALAADSIHTARTGFFLLFVLAYPAARGVRLRAPSPVGLVAATCAFVVLGAAMFASGRHVSNTELARRAAATHEVVLADPLLGEWVEFFGGRIWVGNPIDAFRQSDQRLYLDWTAGDRDGRGAVDHAQLVLVEPTSAAGKAAAADPRLERVASSANAVLYRVKAL